MMASLMTSRSSGSRYPTPEKFAVVFRRHAPAIQRYVIRRIGQEQSDDVVAETFLVAFRQRASFRDDGRDCLPWLYGIATNLVGRHWRTEVRQLRLLARTGADPVTAGSAKAHQSVALDGLRQIRKGQVLSWVALLGSGIVRHPGQLP